MKLVSPILQMVALNGVAIRMEAGVEMEVRESLVESALALGEAPKSSNTLDAMALLIEEANPMDFSRDGTPKVRSIERILGYDITAAERDSAWATFQEA